MSLPRSWFVFAGRSSYVRGSNRLVVYTFRWSVFVFVLWASFFTSSVVKPKGVVGVEVYPPGGVVGPEAIRVFVVISDFFVLYHLLFGVSINY